MNHCGKFFSHFSFIMRITLLTNKSKINFLTTIMGFYLAIILLKNRKIIKTNN